MYSTSLLERVPERKLLRAKKRRSLVGVDAHRIMSHMGAEAKALSIRQKGHTGGRS